MLQLYLHEANRVYRDKLIDDKDLKMFDDIAIDNAKKFFEVSIRSFLFDENISFSPSMNTVQ